MKPPSPLPHGELLRLKRWNTPTLYNGWEQITKHDAAADAFNLEETRDFMPQVGPMVGYAVTVVIEPSNPAHKKHGAKPWSDYRRYIAGMPGPKIVVVQDLDKPRTVGAFWGEVNANNHRALGCVGTIMDANECNSMIAAARGTAGNSLEAILAAMDGAARAFARSAEARFGRKGEWS